MAGPLEGAAAVGVSGGAAGDVCRPGQGEGQAMKIRIPVGVERKTDAELAAEYRQIAGTIRRGGLGRRGARAARRADRNAARLERGMDMTISPTQEQLAEAREWIDDYCVLVGHPDGCRLSETLTDDEVVCEVTRWYCGGWAQFIADGEGVSGP
jgi:hypothetical protein